jgi:hypothetical protein
MLCIGLKIIQAFYYEHTTYTSTFVRISVSLVLKAFFLAKWPHVMNSHGFTKTRNEHVFLTQSSVFIIFFKTLNHAES